MILIVGWGWALGDQGENIGDDDDGDDREERDGYDIADERGYVVRP